MEQKVCVPTSVHAPDQKHHFYTTIFVRLCQNDQNAMSNPKKLCQTQIYGEPRSSDPRLSASMPVGAGIGIDRPAQGFQNYPPVAGRRHALLLLVESPCSGKETQERRGTVANGRLGGRRKKILSGIFASVFPPT